MSGILLYPLAALLYAALAFYYWRTQWVAPGQGPAQSGSPGPAHYYTLLPLALHTWTLSHSAFAPDGLHLGFGVAVSAILWLTVLIYWTGNFFYRLDGLQALVMPLAAVGTLLPLVAPEAKPLPNTESLAFQVHLLIAIVAYSLFTIASLHVLLMTLLERRLHQGGMPVMLQKFPIYADIFDGSALTPGEPVLEVENERYTTNHARVGAHLARSWHLPESLCFAILNHHDILFSNQIQAQAETGALALIALGLAAEQLYSAATGTLCHEWALAGEWALFELDLSQERFADLALRVKTSINHL